MRIKQQDEILIQHDDSPKMINPEEKIQKANGQAEHFSAFITVNKKRYKRKPKNDKTGVDISNRFDILKDETCHFFMIDEEQEEKSRMNQDLIHSVPKESIEEIIKHKRTGKKKVNLNGIKPIETKNRFKLFEDNSGENVDQIVRRKLEIQSIMNIKKCLIKKCRHCNFKKRSCIVDRSNCPASERRCEYCKKVGHYPQSLNCKKKRKGNCRKHSPFDLKSDKHQRIRRPILKLINARIKQLEPFCPEVSTELNDGHHCQQKRTICSEIILMYIFLNYDFIINLDVKNKDGKVINRKAIRESVLK